MTKQPSGAPAPKVSLTVEEKQALIAKAEQEPAWSQSVLAKWATTTFQLYTPLNRTTVSKILLRADEIKSADEFFLKRYNVTRPQFPALEQELVEWIVTVRKQGAGVTGAMIQAEAANIAARQAVPKDKFKCSNGWLERFQNRYRDEIEATLREYAEATGAPISTMVTTAGRRGGGAGSAAGGKRVGSKKAPGVGKRAGKKVPQRAGSAGEAALKQTADAIMDIVGDIGSTPGFDRNAMLGSDARNDLASGVASDMIASMAMAKNEMLKSEMLAYSVGLANSQAAIAHSQAVLANSVGLVHNHMGLVHSQVMLPGIVSNQSAIATGAGLVGNDAAAIVSNGAVAMAATEEEEEEGAATSVSVSTSSDPVPTTEAVVSGDAGTSSEEVLSGSEQAKALEPASESAVPLE